MNAYFKPCLALLALALGMTACSTPYSRQSTSKKPVVKAPVVDRSTRRQPVYPAPPSYPTPPSRQAPLDVAQLPQEDPLLPREYSSPDPGALDGSGSGYASPNAAPPYPNTYYGSVPAQSYPPSAGAAYPPPPAYPPGAAPPEQPSSRPPGVLPEPQPAVVPSAQRLNPPPAPAPAPPIAAAPPVATAPIATPPVASEQAPVAAPPTVPAPTPVTPPSAAAAPATPPPASAGAPAPADTTVAMTIPPQAPAPAAPPPAPPKPPADLPPAEISRDGNQAVVALLESADKYVKSNQLDKAGAALERALRIEPRNAGIWHDLAQIRLHQGQYVQAETLANKSNNLAGGDRDLQSRNWKLIGTARKATGNVAGAEEAEARVSQLSH